MKASIILIESNREAIWLCLYQIVGFHTIELQSKFNRHHPHTHIRVRQHVITHAGLKLNESRLNDTLFIIQSQKNSEIDIWHAHKNVARM